MKNSTSKSEKNAFKKWLKSDNVIKGYDGYYRTQCSLYKIKMTIKQLNKYFTKEYLS